jgi:putative nucleotidyltransferase with HDIG domain
MASFPTGYHPLEQELNRKVLARAGEHKVKLYLVGGYVRDALMKRLGKENHALDLDYAVAGGSAVDFARAMALELAGHFVLLDQACDTARVVLDSGEMLDFAGCVGGNIETDVKRRDFTINALVWDPQDPDRITDLVGGLSDIQSATVRAIAEDNFEDDPLRMLRAFRFSTAIGGKVEPATFEMIRRKSAGLTRSAPERINYELFTIMRSPHTIAALTQMGEVGLLEAIFPELTQTRTVSPNAYHHLGLWDHSLAAVAQAEARLANLPGWVLRDLQTELSAGISRLQATKIACLLHDIGKPATWQITPEGRHTFYGHDRVGAEMCEVVAERLRWSKPVSRFIIKLVRWHLRPGQLFHQGPPTERAVLRFYRTIAEDVPALMVLAFGDLGATRGPGLEGPNREKLDSSLIELLAKFPVFISGQQSMERLLDGNEIMQLLGIEPSPILGEMVEALAEAQALKEVRDRAQAEKFVRSHYLLKYGQ